MIARFFLFSSTFSLLNSITSSCVIRDGLVPNFAPSRSNFNAAFRNYEFILVPSLSFSCIGQVTSWQAYLESIIRYDAITFQVWRPEPGLASCSYQLVGSHTEWNYIPSRNNLLNISTVNTNFSSVIVHPGDVVALYVSNRFRGRNFQTYRNYNPKNNTYELAISAADQSSKTSFSCAEAGVQTEGSVPIVTATVEALPTTPPLGTSLPASTTPPIAVTSSVTAATSFSVTQKVSETLGTEPHPPMSLPTDYEDNSQRPQNQSGSDEMVSIGSGVRDKKLKEEATDSPQGFLGHKEFYLVVGVAAALFVVLAVFCCVIVCWCLVRRRRAYKARQHSISGNRIHSKNKYYERNCRDLEVSDKLDFNDLDMHIYDTVDQPELLSTKLETSHVSQMSNTSKTSADFFTEKSGKLSAAATLWSKSTRRNDYEERPLGMVPRGRENQADPVKWMECSDYEVPHSTIPRRNETKNGLPDPPATECKAPTNREMRKFSEVSQPAAVAAAAAGKSDFTSSHYDVPSNTAINKFRADSSHYDVPFNNSLRLDSNHVDASEKASCPSPQEGSEYDTPCDQLRLGQRIKVSKDLQEETNLHEEDDDDYTSMNAVWNQMP